MHEKKKLKGYEFYFSYLPEFIYGGIDGTITTFAIVSGSVGAGFSIRVLLILGVANLIADGFSMSVGNFFSTKSLSESYAKNMAKEAEEIIHKSHHKKQEIREIYHDKGFRGEDLEKAVNVITSDAAIWLNTLMLERLNLIKAKKAPVKTAMATFISFVIMGFIPLSVYFFTLNAGISFGQLYMYACIATGISLIIIGLLKSLLNETNVLKSVLETISLGGAAAFLAYLVGYLLEQYLLKG
jgi:vacuolar iron transporter family protein